MKEKGIEDIIEKFRNSGISQGEEKDLNMNDNTNMSNNNTNDSNNTYDKLNLNENNKNPNINNYSEQIESSGSNSENKSNKDDESYDGGEIKKNNKVIGRKRGRPSKEEVITIDKKTRGRKKKKIENDNTVKIKKVLNYEDIKQFIPINYPIITSLEDIEKIIPKKTGGKNKPKKLIKMSNNNLDKNIGTKKGKNLTNEKSRQSSYNYDWDLMDKKKLDKKGNNNKLEEVKNKRQENENMTNYDANRDNENIKKTQINNNDNSKNKNNDVKIVNNAVRIVNEKNMELRTQIGKAFGCLEDINMIKMLVYIENIRPQSIRILENDTIYIDLEAFNDDTYNNVFEHLKVFFK